MGVCGIFEDGFHDGKLLGIYVKKENDINT